MPVGVHSGTSQQAIKFTLEAGPELRPAIKPRTAAQNRAVCQPGRSKKPAELARKGGMLHAV